MDRLKPILYIWDSPTYDHAHGIIKVRPLHLYLETDFSRFIIHPLSFLKFENAPEFFSKYPGSEFQEHSLR